MIINPPPNCEFCAGQTESLADDQARMQRPTKSCSCSSRVRLGSSYQSNSYQCYFCGHIGKIVKQPTKQKIEEEVKRIKGLE